MKPEQLYYFRIEAIFSSISIIFFGENTNEIRISFSGKWKNKVVLFYRNT